jgi:hypothetical protein
VLTLAESYDGDGRSLKRVETKTQTTPFIVPDTTETVDYYLRSSVLGGRVITELNALGQKNKTKVYVESEVGAEQVLNNGTPALVWKYSNPVTGSSAEQTVYGLGKKEYDPFGLELGGSDPYLQSAEPDYASMGGSFYRDGGNPFDSAGGYTLNGMPTDFGTISRLFQSGSAAMCPNNNCGPRRVIYQGRSTWAPFHAYADGYQGFVPIGARYIGKGNFSPLKPGPPGLGNYSNGDTNFSLLNGATDEAQLGLTTDSFFGDPQTTTTPTPYTGPCPPTKEQLATNPVVKKTLDEAMEGSQSRRVEHGGWIFWNRTSGRIATYIKVPTIARLNPDITDRYDRIFLNNPPPPPNGWHIVGTFHTHPENVNEDPQDIAVEDSRKIPGMIRMPNGGISPYGAYNRGIWGRDLPKRCL